MTLPPTEERMVKEYRGVCKVEGCEWLGPWRMFLKKAQDETRAHYKEKHPL